jgi:hypothetical protein
MRNRNRMLVALGLVTAAAVPAIAAATTTSNAIFWQNKANTVTCGLMIHPVNSPPMAVLCSASGVPAPKHTTSAQGDPGFVSISSTGSPTLLRLSQDSFVGKTAKTLKNGTVWSAPVVGVTCNVAANGTVLCFNGQNHGFRIGDKHYHSF